MSGFREGHQDHMDEAQRRIEECRRKGETTLDLSGLRIHELPQSLFNLEHLKTLVLSDNLLESVPDDLGKLINLEILFISKQDLLSGLPETLGELAQLEELTISHTMIATLPDGLCRLGKLRTLTISNNSIAALPSDFGHLTSLRALVLQAIYLSSLPENFGNLTSLTSLNLTRNALERVPAQLCRLSNLEELTIASNPLTELPEAIGKLKRLKKLIVPGNSLTNLTPSIGGCASLEKLDASRNLLTTIPPSIGRLKRLESLNLAENVLSRLPATLGDLGSLETLDLSNNRLRYLPRQLSKPPRLATCNLKGNRTKVEVADPLDREGLDGFLHQMWLSKPIQRESRLIVVGEGERGKTTIKNSLLHGRALNCDQTHGIDVDCWPVDPPEGWDALPVDVDIWDFGGQVIYHQVHHLYLRDKSIYLLVFDTRKDVDFKVQIEGWLEAVRTFGKDGPIIFVQNLRGRGATISEDAFRDYQRKYQNLVGMVSLPCLPDLNSPCQKAGSNPDDTNGSEAANLVEPCSCKACHERGLGQLKQMIAQLLFKPRERDQVRGQELIRVLDLEIKEWEVRNELETMGAALDYPVLGRTEAESLCRRHEIDGKAATLLAELHGHGEILAYEDDVRDDMVIPRTNAIRDELYGKVVLRPSWAKDAIYKVFGSDRIKKTGLLHRDTIASLWADRPDRYPREAYNYLLALIESYQLGYSHGQSYVFPYFLPDSRPAEGMFDAADSTRLEFHYKKFFHISLMSRLIVRLHRDLVNAGGKELCWKHGAVLALRQTGVDHRDADREEARALIEFHESFRKITVHVTGPRRVDLIERIRAGLVDVHGEYVEAEEYVPCPCGHCRSSDDPHLYRLNGVRRILYTGPGGDYTVRCDKGDCEKVDVRMILNGSIAESPSSRGVDADIGGLKAKPSAKKDDDFIKKVEAKIAWYLKNVDPYPRAKDIAKALEIGVGTLYNCDNWNDRPMPPFPRRGVRRHKSVRPKESLSHGRESSIKDQREKAPSSGLETFDELWNEILRIGLEECGEETHKWLEVLSSERQSDLVLGIERMRQELIDPAYEGWPELIARVIREQRRSWGA